MKMGKSWLPKLPFWVVILFGYIAHVVSGTGCQNEILKNAVLKLKKGKSKLLDAPFSVGILFEYLKYYIQLICCFSVE